MITLPEHIESQGLVLRPLSRHDLPDLVAACNHIGLARMCMRIPHPYTFEDAETFFNITTSSHEQIWAIDNATHFAGTIGIFNPRHLSDSDIEIGYWVSPNHWRQGVGLRAGQAIISALQTAGVRAVSAGVFADNPASRALLQRLGFHYIKSTEAYSLAREANPAPLDIYRIDFIADKGCESA